MSQQILYNCIQRQFFNAKLSFNSKPVTIIMNTVTSYTDSSLHIAQARVITESKKSSKYCKNFLNANVYNCSMKTKPNQMVQLAEERVNQTAALHSTQSIHVKNPQKHSNISRFISRKCIMNIFYT